jgi:diguanylate cyclase (GGDEF)-like protein
MKDFFISYSHPDENWAEWVAWELDSLGYSVFMQRWSIKPGSNFVTEMDKATQNCKRIIVVLSVASQSSPFVTSEWAAYFARDPAGAMRLVLPIRVQDFVPTGLMAQVVYIDFAGMSESEARRRLYVGIDHVGSKPESKPVFPGASILSDSIAPRYPAVEKGPRTSPFEKDKEYKAALALGGLPSIRRRSYGRAYVEHGLMDLIGYLQRKHILICSVTIDVDGMSSINSKYGIEVGDAVIERTIDICERHQNRVSVIRIGDDTICLVLQKLNLDESLRAARKLLSEIQRNNWNSLALGLYVTCSAGVAEFDLRKEPALSTVFRAVEGQRLARASGRSSASLGPQFLPKDQTQPASSDSWSGQWAWPCS